MAKSKKYQKEIEKAKALLKDRETPSVHLDTDEARSLDLAVLYRRRTGQATPKITGATSFSVRLTQARNDSKNLGLSAARKMTLSSSFAQMFNSNMANCNIFQDMYMAVMEYYPRRLRQDREICNDVPKEQQNTWLHAAGEQLSKYFNSTSPGAALLHLLQQGDRLQFGDSGRILKGREHPHASSKHAPRNVEGNRILHAIHRYSNKRESEVPSSQRVYQRYTVGTYMALRSQFWTRFRDHGPTGFNATHRTLMERIHNTITEVLSPGHDSPVCPTYPCLFRAHQEERKQVAYDTVHPAQESVYFLELLIQHQDLTSLMAFAPNRDEWGEWRKELLIQNPMLGLAESIEKEIVSPDILIKPDP
jgi:hypothetical protein